MLKSGYCMIIGILAGIAITGCLAESEAPAKEGKVLPIFNVVQFPNDQCLASNSNNGTCYTSTECSARGGKSSGSCASGFGVCCVITLSCGESSSENNTYIVQASVTTLTSPCTYTICKMNSNICRIRFNFATFTLAAPATGTVATSSVIATNAGSIGDCTTDTFAVSGNPGSPVICGSNAGRHMIIDATQDCHTANFDIGASTTTTRTWHLHVTQFECNQDSMWGGPPGCLQYYTALTGVITSFNFPSTTPITASVTHLSSQCQTVCIRRTATYCYICYIPTITASTSAAIQASFGLSVSPSAPASQAAVGTNCLTDYIEIPGATTLAIASTATSSAFDTTSYDRLCGRFFGTQAATASATVCSRSPPFILKFVSDANEATTGTAAITTSTNEQTLFTGGITGFSLIYTQSTC